MQFDMMGSGSTFDVEELDPSPCTPMYTINLFHLFEMTFVTFKSGPDEGTSQISTKLELDFLNTSN